MKRYHLQLAMSLAGFAGLGALAACSSDSTQDGAADAAVNPDATPRPDAHVDTPDSGPLVLDLSVVGSTVAARVQPGAVLDVAVRVRNDSSRAWDQTIQLAFTGDASWVDTALLLDGAGTVAPGEEAAFVGHLTAPLATGRFTLGWKATYLSMSFGPTVEKTVEVTCSDGVFCNGEERFAGGHCVAGVDPCDDNADCTVDQCDEATGLCDSIPMGADCDRCNTNCTPSCNGRSCGDDGCGSICGTCFGPDIRCAGGLGVCVPFDQPGSCQAPLFLFADDAPARPGRIELTGDTSGAFHQITPSCNQQSTAAEMVYTFTTTVALGIDARSYGYDTVLDLRRGTMSATSAADCADDRLAASVDCSDDSSPPGDYGSRIAESLPPGRYYLIVDGYAFYEYGPFTLSVTFAPNGCVPSCDGVYCGNDDGCGGDCGLCEMGSVCEMGRCVQDPCQPDCAGKQCGADGCGGSCGTCTPPDLCVDATHTCQPFPECDHFRPTCNPACGADAYCGADCACHGVTDPQPDLVVDREALARDLQIDTLMVDPSSCTVVENCVGGTGLRKILRFTMEASNQGHAALVVPQPPERPDLFEYSPCHDHYHFKGFSNYLLLDTDGHTVVTGRKQAFCMEDTEQIRFGPQVSCEINYTCDAQGIQAGWADIYGTELDCQWLDITGVPPGDYVLETTLNPNRLFEEASFENNTARVPVTIPAN